MHLLLIIKLDVYVIKTEKLPDFVIFQINKNINAHKVAILENMLKSLDNIELIIWSREFKFTRGFRTFIWYIIAAILPTSNLGQLYIRVITGRVSVQSHMQKYAKQFRNIYKIQLNLGSFYNILYTVPIPYVILQRN